MTTTRSHLVERTPAQQVQDLQPQIDDLTRRVTRLEDYIRERTWSRRWMRFKVWWLNLPAWMANYPELVKKRRKR